MCRTEAEPDALWNKITSYKISFWHLLPAALFSPQQSRFLVAMPGQNLCPSQQLGLMSQEEQKRYCAELYTLQYIVVIVMWPCSSPDGPEEKKSSIQSPWRKISSQSINSYTRTLTTLAESQGKTEVILWRCSMLQFLGVYSLLLLSF